MALRGRRRQVSTSVAADVETRSHAGPSFSIGDPALGEYMGLAGRNDSGVAVTESSSLAFTAVWRAVQVIAGTIAGLPLKSFRNTADGRREAVSSFLDNLGGEYLTPYEFKELTLTHLLLHGNAYLLHMRNGAGSVVSLMPVHPSLVTVAWDATLQCRTYGIPDVRALPFTEAELTHVMGLSTDGLKGLSPIHVARNAIGTGLAGDQAAARMFSSGLLIGGLVTPDGDMDEDQATEALTGLKARISGVRNAGDLVLANAALKVQPWTMSSEDAQFIQTRVHQVEEVARIFGVPPHLLGQTEKATSWGTGISEQNRGLARYTLASWTTRLEERLSRLLPQPQFCEFEYAGLLQAAPEVEIPLLLAQVAGGLLTVDEARAIRNLPPLAVPAPTEPAPPVDPPAAPVPPTEEIQ